MILYHLELANGKPKKKFHPSIPLNRMEGEDKTIKRICVAPSIEECLQSVSWGRINYIPKYIPVIVYVFDTEDYIPSKDLKKYVPDAIVTNEYWITKEIKPIKHFYIADINYDFSIINYLGNEYYKIKNCRYRKLKQEDLSYSFKLELNNNIGRFFEKYPFGNLFDNIDSIIRLKNSYTLYFSAAVYKSELESEIIRKYNEFQEFINDVRFNNKTFEDNIKNQMFEFMSENKVSTVAYYEKDKPDVDDNAKCQYIKDFGYIIYY